LFPIIFSSKTNLELEILIYRQLLQEEKPIVLERNEIVEQMISKEPIKLSETIIM